MTNGIFTLANDVVYDQLVALLNSIEANVGKDIPVCIIPYDDRLELVKAEVERRPNVTLFDNPEIITYWENFATKAWDLHPYAQKVWNERGMPESYRLARHRKLCAVSGPFDKFVYFDADTLAMNSLDDVFQKLDEYDWVTNDFQYKSDVCYIYDAPEEKRLRLGSPEEVRSHIFCSGWFASKKAIFDETRLNQLLEHLKQGDGEVISLQCIDQPLLNYMVLRSGIPYYNFAYHDNQNATGSHWSSPYEVKENILYNSGRQIAYLHYMSISSSQFQRLCTGEDVGIPYQDVFLHYRYLNAPEQRPQIKPPSKFLQMQRATQKLINRKSGNLKSKLSQFKNRLAR